MYFFMDLKFNKIKVEQIGWIEWDDMNITAHHIDSCVWKTSIVKTTINPIELQVIWIKKMAENIQLQLNKQIHEISL